ncbi:CehA/McbA family metallohydrolase [Haloarcula marina]|uniref:CehA/McbA family metallohydrolase n=1 Tax=Haloarcula marina TaxID=2961574 RepID=UPI0020B6BDC8|nr:PHP domain-containing protein [Halomicroarcula marina]
MSGEYFSADLHTHTSWSYDSLQPPATVARYAEQVGLDAIAITDHDEFGAHAEVNESTEVMVIPGMEVRTRDYDDLLALFITEQITSDTLASAVDEIHSQGGLAILPHPYRKVTDFEEWVFRKVDAVEGLNARSRTQTNVRATALGQHHDCPLTGGSDAHTPWEVGRARTIVSWDPITSLAELKSAIREGAVAPTGTESPYYLYHGLSKAMETVKSVK